MTLLFDENIPPGIVAALRHLNHDVTHVSEHHLRRTPDAEIFRLVAAQGWGFVTRDKDIRRDPHQRAALREAGVGAFFYTGSSKRTLDEQTILILRTIGAMEALAQRTLPPYIFSVSDQAKIERIGDPRR